MTGLQVVLLLGTLVLGGVLGLVLGRAQARRRRALLPDDSPRREAERLRAEAEEEARRLLREAEIAAREAALGARAEAENVLRLRESDLADTDTRLAARAVALEVEREGLSQAKERLEARQA